MSTVVRLNPFREMAAMQSAMDRIFDEVWRNAEPTLNHHHIPVDIYETPTAYTLRLVVPGLNPDDIQVNFHEGALVVSGEFHQPERGNDTQVLTNEIFYGSFSRSFNLPQTIEVDKVQAAYEHGILTLTLPKAPSAQPRRIPISLGSKLLNNKN